MYLGSAGSPCLFTTGNGLKGSSGDFHWKVRSVITAPVPTFTAAHHKHRTSVICCKLRTWLFPCDCSLNNQQITGHNEASQLANHHSMEGFKSTVHPVQVKSKLQLANTTMAEGSAHPPGAASWANTQSVNTGNGNADAVNNVQRLLKGVSTPPWRVTAGSSYRPAPVPPFLKT